MAFTYDPAKFIPFRDKAACERVRAITKEDITKHPNPDFHIRVIDEPAEFYLAFALDIVTRIRQALEESRRFVGIFPVGPMPQYPIAAQLINQLRIPMHHVHTFNMDEYADQDGNTAPVDWRHSFQRAMLEQFFGKIDPELRPPMEQIHFPTKAVIGHYGEMIEELGGADICYGGIGWCGHIAFWEPQLGYEFGDDLEAYKKAGPRLVELHPMTIMQSALHSFGGDWSWVPPKANTIGPAQIVQARYRSFWLGGTNDSLNWKRFVARLCAHGPVNTLVPGTLLQTTPGDYTILDSVARNVDSHLA
jgi:glucosamine-6-phosphate deaminase